METLEQILLAHRARYPLMEPTDAVKLIYQNEFGGGHLIRDEENCLNYLRREYESVTQSADAPLAEDIGNGMVRIHLDALEHSGYTVEQLGADFIRSARIHRGSMEQFLAKLEVLRQLTLEGRLPFSAEALDAYLEDYRQKGYPMVSHSDAYRKAYSPAYRIIFVNSQKVYPTEMNHSLLQPEKYDMMGKINQFTEGGDPNGSES